MVDINDDLGTYTRSFKVVACIPVFRRLPLLRYTIRRLLHKNRVHAVVCVGNRFDERRLCEEEGAHWVNYKNYPLGEKWNVGFKAAKAFDPDACVFIGSSDWISDNWLEYFKYKDFDLIGLPGCHFLHLGETNKLCYWPGYTNQRIGESIGIGRMISRELLNRLQFTPFEGRLNNSLDHSMQVRSKLHAARIQCIDTNLIISVSISTDAWPNKHRFFDHYNNILPSVRISDVDNWIENNFPEAKQVCESLKDTSVRA